MKNVTERIKKEGRAAKIKNYDKIINDDSIKAAMDAINLCISMNIKIQIYWGGNYYDLTPSPSWIVWDKRTEEKYQDINSDCELAYVIHPSKKSVRIFRHLWKGMIKDSEHGQASVHPTQKPVALAEWCFEKYGGAELETVLDLFWRLRLYSNCLRKN